MLLFQDADDLLFAEPALLHRPSPHRRTLASERGQDRGQGHTPYLLAAYTVRGYWDGTTYYYPRNWTVLASNDGATWTQIDTQAGVTYASNGAASALFVIPAANRGSYLYYRLNVTAAQNNSSGEVANRVCVVEWMWHTLAPAVEQDTSFPFMASATTTVSGVPGYRVTASSETTNAAWRAMDGAVATGVALSCWDTDAGTASNWIQHQAPTPNRVGAYAVNWGFNDGTNYMYANGCQLFGSNDGVTFTALDSPRQINNITNDNYSRAVFHVPAANQGFYIYHRLVITGVRTNLSGTRIILPEFSLLKVIQGVEAATSAPVMTSNTAPAGYVASASSVYQAGFEAYKAFDGKLSTYNGAWSDGLWHGTNSLPGWVQRQFPAPVKALAYRFAHFGQSYMPTGWRLSGSNDGATWTDVDVRTVNAAIWSNANNLAQYMYFTVQNPGSYLYYRFNFVGGGDGYARMSELELLQASLGPMDVRSQPVPATQGVPAKATLMAIVRANVGTITVNTNLIASISRDGGATFKDFVLSPVGPLGAYTQYSAPSLDLTSLPSGSSMVTRFRTVGATLGVVLDSYVPLWG